MNKAVGVDDIRLVQTCDCYPEQYDAYVGANRVAYLRLRHGHFYVQCPRCQWFGGEIVYWSAPVGDGEFVDEERAEELANARRAICEWLARNPDFDAIANEYAIRIDDESRLMAEWAKGDACTAPWMIEVNRRSAQRLSEAVILAEANGVRCV